MICWLIWFSEVIICWFSNCLHRLLIYHLFIISDFLFMIFSWGYCLLRNPRFSMELGCCCKYELNFIQLYFFPETELLHYSLINIVSIDKIFEADGSSSHVGLTYWGTLHLSCEMTPTSILISYPHMQNIKYLWPLVTSQGMHIPYDYTKVRIWPGCKLEHQSLV